MPGGDRRRGGRRRRGRRGPSCGSPAGAAAGTHFLDHGALLAGYNDQQWYERNIPFVDLPDKTIQDVYYYRWRTWKEHLRYTNPTDGWVLTEFLACCGYAAPYETIDAAAGHHIDEGRWVRDRSYLDDYTRFWLTGPGAGAKPKDDGVNADTTDWAHEYSFWLPSAAYARAQVTGDFSQLVALLPQLERQYRGWDGQFNADLGLYWSVPVWDASEFSPSSYESSDPYHGGAGYRPTINAYQYGDAVAISRVAALAGDTAKARDYAARAAALKAAMQKWLWDPSRQFFFDMPRDGNPDHHLLDTREEMGYVPWQFGAADSTDSAAWGQLLDPQGFKAPYGPTTAERRSRWFMHDAGNCCRWDGPSWPFATSQTLTGLANQLDDLPAQTAVTTQDYVDALHTYAATQDKDGHPYVAEAHAPDDPRWIYDERNHSEDYNHSTFNDLVLSGLLGLRAQDGATLQLKPLVPASWDHFAVENAPYHGHDVTVLWDRDGSHYGQGAGMRVYVDGTLTRTSPTVTALTVPVGPTAGTGTTTVAGAGDRTVDDAANPLRSGYPKPVATGTWGGDSPWSAVDGKVWFTEVPENTRWTNYGSPNPQDSYGVDFGVPTPVSDIRWYGYDDGGGVKPAAAYQLQYWTGTAWADVPGQSRSSAKPVGNGLNEITFPTLTTTQVRLLFTNPAGAFVGVTELESWSPSSGDATVAVGPAGRAGSSGPVTVQGRTPVDVTVTNRTRGQLTSPRVSLALPAGWTATPTGTSGTTGSGTVAPGASAVWHFAVAAPASAVGADASAVATATYADRAGARTTHTRQSLRVAFDPAAYGTVLVDDRFTTDTLGDYTVTKPSGDEVVPALSAGGGALTATSDQRFFTVLDRRLSPGTTDSAVIVDPARFIGNAPHEDTLFVGLVDDRGNTVRTWYNNHFHTSGIDASSNGACCAAVTLTPGTDRLALQVHGTTVTSWAQVGGTWQRLLSTDVGSGTDLSGYHVVLGLRGDHGTVAASRFQALARTP